MVCSFLVISSRVGTCMPATIICRREEAQVSAADSVPPGSADVPRQRRFPYRVFPLHELALRELLIRDELQPEDPRVAAVPEERRQGEKRSERRSKNGELGCAYNKTHSICFNFFNAPGLELQPSNTSGDQLHFLASAVWDVLLLPIPRATDPTASGSRFWCERSAAPDPDSACLPQLQSLVGSRRSELVHLGRLHHVHNLCHLPTSRDRVICSAG